MSTHINTVGDIWHRYEERSVASGGYNINGEWERFGPSYPELSHRRFTVAKVTPKGVWLRNIWVVSPIQQSPPPWVATEMQPVSYKHMHWVSMTTYKRFACESEKLALESYIARKERQLKILHAKIFFIDRAVLLADGRLEKLSDG